LQAEIDLVRQSIAEIGQFFLEPSNLGFWLLVTLSGYASGRPSHVYCPRPIYRRLLKQNFIPHQSTFLVRDIFARHGLFRVDLKQAMDYEFWLRIAFEGGERYQVLPFATTYFLEGGRASRLFELLKYLVLVRRELRQWVSGLTPLDDVVFLARVAAFWVYSALRGIWVNAK
jgi:hypothetical protein